VKHGPPHAYSKSVREIGGYRRTCVRKGYSAEAMAAIQRHPYAKPAQGFDGIGQQTLAARFVDGGNSVIDNRRAQTQLADCNCRRKSSWTTTDYAQIGYARSHLKSTPESLAYPV
jgi:hypothetical protein